MGVRSARRDTLEKIYVLPDCVLVQPYSHPNKTAALPVNKLIWGNNISWILPDNLKSTTKPGVD